MERSIFGENTGVLHKQPCMGTSTQGRRQGLRSAPASSEAGQLAVTPGRVSSLGRARVMFSVEKLFSEVLALS